jgi:hypothetical protein
LIDAEVHILSTATYHNNFKSRIPVIQANQVVGSGVRNDYAQEVNQEIIHQLNENEAQI